jgi:hypothetical protein
MSTYVAVCPVLFNAAMLGAFAGMSSNKAVGITSSTDAGIVQMRLAASAFAQQLDGTTGYGAGVAIPGTAPSAVLATAGATIPPTTAALANALTLAGHMYALCKSAFEGRSAVSVTPADYAGEASYISALWAGTANIASIVSLL